MNNELLIKYFRIKLFCDVYTIHSSDTIKPPVYYAKKALEIFDKEFPCVSQTEEDVFSKSPTVK